MNSIFRLLFVSESFPKIFQNCVACVNSSFFSSSSAGSILVKSSGSEKIISPESISLNSILAERKICTEDEFECTPGYCVSTSRRCDGVNDCQNKKDELNCGVYNSTKYNFILNCTKVEPNLEDT